MTGLPPLHGTRVIELGQLIAGPFCGQLPGEFGADIIKVEAPDRPDPARDWGGAKLDDMLEDAQIRAREPIDRIADPLLGRDVPMQAVVPKLPATPGGIHGTGPALGADTDALLAELGYSAPDIQEMRDAKVI